MRTVGRLLSSLAVLAAFAALPATAQEYSADDVVSFFSEGGLGATRAICVGTAQECAEQAAPSGFDILVNFELDSATLTEQAKTNLSQVAAALADDRLKDAKFVLEGHTDAYGTEAYNKVLAERRAQAVADFLVAQGVSAERIDAIGLGMSAPRVEDPFDPINRRVEMKLNLQ